MVRQPRGRETMVLFLQNRLDEAYPNITYTGIEVLAFVKLRLEFLTPDE